ncbi:MAG: sulfatase [Myxococcota bacterium]
MADSNWPLPTRDRFAHLCGEVAVAAMVTGMAASLPAALRVAPHSSSFFTAWLALAGIGAAAGALVVVLLRTATSGIRKAMPEPGDRATGLVAIAIWMLLSVVLLAGFGTVLSAVTHHRGLGGATFAWVGIGVVALSALVAWRAAHLLGSIGRRPPVAWAAFAASALTVGGVVFASARGAKGDAGPALAVVDATLFAGLAIATSRIRLPSANKRIWVPAAMLALVALIGTGIGLLNRLASAGTEARSQVRIVSPLLQLIASPDTQPKRRPPKSKPVPPVVPAVSSEAPPSTGPSAPEKANESAANPAPRRIDNPDIIVVTLDTLRADHLGLYGYERKTSPHLDAFAADAVVFERAYAAGPETRTAIAPLATCKHLAESVRDDRDWPTLLRANETVAERLRAKGYATGAVTSFQWLSKVRGFDQGFDVFDEQPFKRVHPEKGVTGAHAVAQAMAAYDKLTQQDKPVFLWLHLFDPHASYQSHDNFVFGDGDKDKYDSEIAYVDRELSRFVEHVGNHERGSKTVWIVHGSHGEAFGEHGFSGHPPKMYEEVVRVPLVVKLPWAKPRRVQDPPVSMLDVPATVLSLALGDVGDCSGRSLLELAEGTANEIADRQMLLIAYDGIRGQPPAYGWLDSRVKYVLYAWREGERTLLFDLRADAAEQQDIRSERPGQAIKLRQQLDTHLQQAFRRTKESPQE